MPDYKLPYIANRKMFLAVSFSLSMMARGTPSYKANYRAADYYGVDACEVAHYTGIVGGKASAEKRRKRAQRNGKATQA